VARQADVVLVIGSDNSSNSNRLVEVSRALGTPAHLIDDESEIDPGWLEGAEAVGVTSGASAPEWLVERVVEHLRNLGAGEVEELQVTEEHMAFGLPRGVRESDEARLGAATAG
jgi:4-hydroxy-3-methylbut-2-enyl diphosphate reductase